MEKIRVAETTQLRHGNLEFAASLIARGEEASARRYIAMIKQGGLLFSGNPRRSKRPCLSKVFQQVIQACQELERAGETVVPSSLYRHLTESGGNLSEGNLRYSLGMVTASVKNALKCLSSDSAIKEMKPALYL